MALTAHNGKQHLWMAGKFSRQMTDPPVRGIEIEACQSPDGNPLSISRVHCGGFFAILLTADGATLRAQLAKNLSLLVAGKIWSLGCPRGADMSNGSLLGRPELSDTVGGVEYIPAPVKLPAPDIRISRVSCSTYTGVAVSTDGLAYTWGDRDGSATGLRSLTLRQHKTEY